MRSYKKVTIVRGTFGGFNVCVDGYPQLPEVVSWNRAVRAEKVLRDTLRC